MTIRAEGVAIAPGAEGGREMCLTCGCMDAHRDMGESHIRYEDLEQAADENGRSVAETLAIMARTEANDRAEHPQEYGQPG
jgi:hypothetical protein